MTEPLSHAPRIADAAGLNDVERYRSSLQRYFARRIADRAEAEDLVQDVFFRLTRRGSLEDVDNLSGYIFETAASVGLSLGDRFCLALAQRDGLPAWTSDQKWKRIADAVEVKVVAIR